MSRLVGFIAFAQGLKSLFVRRHYFIFFFFLYSDDDGDGYVDEDCALPPPSEHIYHILLVLAMTICCIYLCLCQFMESLRGRV